MKKFLIILLSTLLIIPEVISQHGSRNLFNDDWKFHLGDTAEYASKNFSDEKWRRLKIPHDWSIEGRFSKQHPATPGGGALPGGTGWYRKTFFVEKEKIGKRIYIEFDGVYRNCEVFINGHSVGKRPNGYVSFHYDLTQHIQFGKKNLIAVRVDNAQQPNSRWYSGSGIYRNVWLTTVSPVHVKHWGVFVSSGTLPGNKASVRIDFTIANESGLPVWAQIKNDIYDPNGNLVSSSAPNSLRRIPSPYVLNSLYTEIDEPSLWSTENPALYRLITTVIVNDKEVDRFETRFGIRSFYFDREKGFFLNEKPMKIIGVCNHHDLGALGAAINTRALERQLEILKAMGCNAIRTAHNPPAPELLDLADKMGFLVMNEAFDTWTRPKSKYDYHLDWEEWHKKDLEDLVKRDRNHPSVILWSVGNEIGEQWGDDSIGRRISRELVKTIRTLDTTRPIITANNEVNTWNNLIQSNAFELVGYNYNHTRWKDFLNEWPGKKLIVTESTSALQTRGYYDLIPFDSIRRWPEAWDKPIPGGGNKDLTVSAYDHVSTPWGSTHEESIKEFLKWDHVSGMFVWTGFDYLGEPTPYPWPARSSYFGIIDLAGFPKDVYYLYQSVFTTKPVLHLYPHWNWRMGDTVDVVAYYNNADAVELFLNGRSLGLQFKKGDDLHVKWRIPFMPGSMKAISTKNGKKVLEREMHTAGKPSQLKLVADRKKIRADGYDLSFITIEIKDKNDIVVPYANNLVEFEIRGEGLIEAVDNGSPVSLEPFKNNSHTAMNGKLLCIIRSTNKEGLIRLTAKSEGLEPSTLEIISE